MIVSRSFFFTAVCLSVFGLTFATAAVAQERTADGTQNQQSSWKALSDIAAAADTRVKAVDTRVVEGVECGKRGMLYVGKGTNGADAYGCIAAAYDSSLLDKFVFCGNKNQVYSKAEDSCKSTSSSQVSANCRLETTSVSANTSNGGKCPTGYNSFGTVLTGYSKPAFHDGCETCNPIYTTTCGRSVCQ